MSAPTSSFEMDSLDSKITVLVEPDTVLIKDSDDGNKLKEASVSDILRFVWTGSDEKSSLTVGIKSVTEINTIQKRINRVVLSLTNEPTGGVVEVDILKETSLNSNLFVSIFSILPTIDVNTFSSIGATIPAVISDNILEVDRRLQIKITTVDMNNSATGLKVELL